VADVVDIAGSREEITLIFFVFLYVSQPLGFHKPTEENEREPAKGRKIISN
jgi:hypothetical protein